MANGKQDANVLVLVCLQSIKIIKEIQLTAFTQTSIKYKKH